MTKDKFIFNIEVKVTVVLLFGLALMPVHNLRAQTSSILEEVVVTAQKREESIQDVPITITAFSNDDLQFHHLANSNDLAAVTPGLNINGPYVDSNPKIVMRGLGTDDFTQTFQSTVGFYLDEVYLGSVVGATVGLFDLERVEVLKGPQGTLYGRNTTGGAINFISRKPGDEFAVNGKVGVGNFDSWEVEGGIDMPLTENLKARVALKSYVRQEGTTKNRANGDTLNDSEYQAGRAQLLYTPQENFTALVIFDAFFNDSDGLVGQQINGQVGGADYLGYQDTDNDNYAGEYTRRGADKIDMWGAALHLDWDLGWGQVKSISAYRTFDHFRIHEPDSTAAVTFETEDTSDYEQFSQELRLHTDLSDNISLVAGAYYYTDELNSSNFAFYTDSGYTAITNWVPTQDVESYAVFGNIEFDITQQLTLFGGVRWTYEKRDYTYEAHDVLPDANGRPLVNQIYWTYVPLTNIEEDWDAVTGEAGLSYALNDDFMIYGKYSRGFKSGGFDGLAFDVGELEPYDPEFINAFEIGTKTTLLNGRLQANLALYYYELSDMQAVTEIPDPNQPIGSIVAIDNAAKAEIKGLDLDIIAQPTDELFLSFGLSLLDTKIKEFQSLGRDLSGDELYSAPPVNFNARAEYHFALGNGGSITPGVQVTYTADMFFDVDNDVARRFRPGSYYLVDTRVQYDAPDGNYYIALWAKNVLDEEYITYANALDISTIDVAFFNVPRTFGAEIGFNF